MYQLGAKSQQKLVAVHPSLVRVVTSAIGVSAQDFSVYEGLRSLKTQTENVARGVSKTMASKHLRQPDGYSHAVDLVPWVAGQLRWEWGPIYHVAAAMAQAADLHGVPLRWGGVWDREFRSLPNDATGLAKAVHDYVARRMAEFPGESVFIDGPHFELASA